MNEQLEQIKKQFEAEMREIADAFGLDQLEQKYFSRKSGVFTLVMKNVRDLTDEARREFGRAANDVKTELESLLAGKKALFQEQSMADIAAREAVDVTEPVLPPPAKGHLHPLTQVLWKLEDVARSMGFFVTDGPELESDYYVFGALNFPADHPARESMDTFYIKDHPNWLMRTHVSNMQVRLMRTFGAPFRAAYPGKCFRNEATDPRHEHTLYQYEFFVIDKEITIAHMIGVIKELLQGLYEKKIEVRLRPKYYPFVEPGVNGEVTCVLCDGQGCRVCKYSGWLEIFGAGLVHPNVLKEGGLDPKEWSGFACGMGLDRLVMLKYGIEDIRHMQSGDMRFLNQF